MDVAALSRHPAVDRARASLRERDAETLAAMVELAQIPAPPFGEAARGERIRRWFEEIGLQCVTVDEVGNVLAVLPANGAARTDSDAHRPVLLCAHMDTVFPEGTDVTVHRVGDRLAAPGIADNARGLAALIALATVLVEARPPLVRPVVFAATVGEEGIGDLRGVKHLFREGSPWRRAAAFIALDGTGSRRIVNRGLGSRRYRVTIEGSGGHSWADWGRANPIHALGRAVAALAALELPRRPRTTLSVGRIEGGTAVNAIPTDAWMELDIRSEDERVLDTIEARALRESNEPSLRRSGEPPGRRPLLRFERIGDRPGRDASHLALVAAVRGHVSSARSRAHRLIDRREHRSRSGSRHRPGRAAARPASTRRTNGTTTKAARRPRPRAPHPPRRRRRRDKGPRREPRRARGRRASGAEIDPCRLGDRRILPAEHLRIVRDVERSLHPRTRTRSPISESWISESSMVV